MNNWVIKKSPYSSKILLESKIFGDSIYLLDHYSGREPFLYNGKKSNNFAMTPHALLDSNMVSELYLFIENNKKSGKNDFRDFLYFITKNRWNVSLHFYYLESFCKSDLDTFRKYAIRDTKAWLELMLMDEEYFLKTSIVKRTNNSQQIDHYLQNKSLDEQATEQVSQFIDMYCQFKNDLEIIQILLIKMILIKNFEMKDKKIEKQLEYFDFFMQEQFGKVLGRELCLAYQYFTNKAGKFLGIQKGTKYENAVKNIISTAWDIFLLRIPELFLKEPDTDKIFDLQYIVTKEKRLFEFSQLFEYEAILFVDGVAKPIFNFNIEEQINYYPIKSTDKGKHTGDIALLLEAMKLCLQKLL
ncbi:Uncharacterised protein [Phocoenobacter uteri]|uniref:Uncharacterized protein n=1 Tax=Phocoenobacter uteri TaxID=146806 RepID=A0A379C988_9PAST|nr:hypothetical protein [Phocoenobacter uteri]MDG6882668.1 hypothetical protein [Phocoenobacter uteri]SUB58834.1 Uncharacterised protein [Phocoenobacter uteri]